MGNSTVLEQGTHAELIKQDGGYAKMYDLQASQFRWYYLICMLWNGTLCTNYNSENYSKRSSVFSVGSDSFFLTGHGGKARGCAMPLYPMAISSLRPLRKRSAPASSRRFFTSCTLSLSSANNPFWWNFEPGFNSSQSLSRRLRSLLSTC